MDGNVKCYLEKAFYMSACAHIKHDTEIKRITNCRSDAYSLYFWL